MIRALRPALAAPLALLVAAACDGIVGPLPREGAPDQLEFSTGGFMVGSSSLALRGDTVLAWSVPWDGPGAGGIDTVRAVPTAEQWRQFWAAADRAGVRRWRGRYVDEEVVDGGGWSLRLVASGEVVRSYGSNAYPDRLGRERPEPPAEFRALTASLRGLAGGAW